MTAIATLITAGPLSYKHIHNQTNTSHETAHHTLAVPPALVTLATKAPGATVAIYGDDTLGIDIDGKTWAAEAPHPEMRPAKTLPHEVWQYLKLAMGRNGDTCA